MFKALYKTHPNYGMVYALLSSSELVQALNTTLKGIPVKVDRRSIFAPHLHYVLAHPEDVAHLMSELNEKA